MTDWLLKHNNGKFKYYWPDLKYPWSSSEVPKNPEQTAVHYPLVEEDTLDVGREPCPFGPASHEGVLTLHFHSQKLTVVSSLSPFAICIWAQLNTWDSDDEKIKSLATSSPLHTTKHHAAQQGISVSFPVVFFSKSVPSVFFYRKEDWSTEEDPSRPTYHWGGKPPPTYVENLASMVEKVTTGFFLCHVCGCEIRGPNRAISHAYKHATGKIRDARREKNATLHTAQGPGDEPCFQTSSGSDPKSFGKWSVFKINDI